MRARATLTLALLAIPDVAHATDYSGLVPYVFGGIAILLIASFVTVWLITFLMEKSRMRLAVRLLAPFPLCFILLWLVWLWI